MAGAESLAPNAKRKRQKTNRFGSEETTCSYNSFFEGVELNTNITSPSAHVESNTVVDVVVNEDNCGIFMDAATSSNIHDLLRAILAKVDGFEKRFEKFEYQLSKLEVYNTCLMTTTTTSSASERDKSVIDVHELQKLGLPAESLEDLQKLEENLKSEDFSATLVCLFRRFACLFLFQSLFSFSFNKSAYFCFFFSVYPFTLMHYSFFVIHFFCTACFIRRISRNPSLLDRERLNDWLIISYSHDSCRKSVGQEEEKDKKKKSR